CAQVQVAQSSATLHRQFFGVIGADDEHSAVVVGVRGDELTRVRVAHLGESAPAIEIFQIAMTDPVEVHTVAIVSQGHERVRDLSAPVVDLAEREGGCVDQGDCGDDHRHGGDHNCGVLEVLAADVESHSGNSREELNNHRSHRDDGGYHLQTSAVLVNESVVGWVDCRRFV